MWREDRRDPVLLTASHPSPQRLLREHPCVGCPEAREAEAGSPLGGPGQAGGAARGLGLGLCPAPSGVNDMKGHSEE